MKQGPLAFQREPTCRSYSGIAQNWRDETSQKDRNLSDASPPNQRSSLSAGRAAMKQSAERPAGSTHLSGFHQDDGHWWFRHKRVRRYGRHYARDNTSAPR